MNYRTSLTAAVTSTLLAVSVLPASAFPFGKKKSANQYEEGTKLTASQSALIDKTIAKEVVVIKTLKLRTPLVETYIQNMKPDAVMGQVPISDQHFLGRVDFGKVMGNVNYADQKAAGGGKFSGLFRHSAGFVSDLSNSLHLNFNETGFVDMLLVDSNNFNKNTYDFRFLRNEFLGTIPTDVFDVSPSKKGAFGRFDGRIWVDRNSGSIVRFNGSFAGSEKDAKEFFHFDSWRTNVQDGLWLPTSVYIEETDPKSPTHTLKFKAINYIWGYSLKVPEKEADLTSLQVQGATDESSQSSDVSPLQAEHEWVQQAEDNVLERLYTAGLIDAPSPFDDILSALANNILIYNKIQTSSPIKVRTLLTEPLETTSFGNTILISKGLIDTAAVPTSDGNQLEGNLDAILAFQLAHIVDGDHVDTKYAFSDSLMFPSESAFQHLPMGHTDPENAAAAKKAMEMLSVKDLADKEQYFGLYLQQLRAREAGLKALSKPQIGDSLFSPDGNFWLQGLIAKAPKLDDKNLTQQAAMPLGSLLRFNPWTDQVIQMHAPTVPVLSPRDKLPFEITPVYLKLTYWQPPAPPAPPTAPAASATSAPVGAPQAAADQPASPAAAPQK
jgi:hypothetical protein